ncbi:MAG: amidohydrolase, partial [bacterium]
FRMVLRFGAEAWKVADLLAKRGIPVIVGPIGQQPSNFESPGARYDNAALLRKAGVTIAIQTAETHNVRNLPFAAGMAAAHGLTPEEALEAITAGAARVLGIAGRCGTLEKGKVANIAIFEGEPDGDPLQPRTKLRQLFIRGKSVPLTSRQTELFEKYR